MILQICIGFLLVVLGVIIIKYGDKDLTKERSQGGIILKLFSQSYLNPKLLKWQRKFTKWGIGLAAIWFGMFIIFDVMK